MPFEANMAIRTAAQKAVRFDNNLGPSPNFRRTGERDRDAVPPHADTGITGWWVPEARDPVTTSSRNGRFHRQYVFNYYYAIGETMAYLDSVKSVHYMNRDGKTPSLVRAGPTVLNLTAAVQWLLFVGFTAIGLTRRGLYHLRRQAIARGAAKFKAQAA